MTLKRGVCTDLGNIGDAIAISGLEYRTQTNRKYSERHPQAISPTSFIEAYCEFCPHFDMAEKKKAEYTQLVRAHTA